MTVKGLSVPLRIENAFVAYMHYLGNLFWPVDLVVPYPHPRQWPWFSVLCGIALVLGLSAAAVRLRRAWPFLFTGWFWFAGMLIPVIGLVQVGTQSMADRYTYLPLIGVLIAFSWGAAAVADSLQLPSGARWFAAVLLAGMCAARTSSQLLYWHDNGSLFRHALEASTDNYVAHDNLSAFLYRQGDVDDAMEHCYQAMQIQPNDAVAYHNLGHGLYRKGRFSEAIDSFHKALELNPRYASAWSNLGSVFLEEKEYDAAFECYRSAIRLQPEDAETLNDLGGLFLLRKQFKEAIDCFERALRFQPDHIRAHVNLANALVETGDRNGAIENFRTALRLNPEDPVVHLFLAKVLSESGRIDEAIAEYQAALRINPQFGEARAGLADALEAKRKLEAR
jgi:tetratricopeptide (TPR) repeat protein